MRALFKPEDGNVLLVRDADFNESTLLRSFCDKIKKGATIEVQERNTGVNDLLTGIVLMIQLKMIQLKMIQLKMIQLKMIQLLEKILQMKLLEVRSFYELQK